MGKFLINFFGIGAARCGTTWIAKCLEEHPQVCFSSLKETTYFAEYTELYRGKNELFLKDFKWYKALFSHCSDGHLKGEFSTDYIHNTKTPKLIHEYFPKAKLIISLRDPVSRLISYYLHLKNTLSHKKLPNSFFEALKDENFIYRSKYYEQLIPWFKYFPREQIKIVIFEELRLKPDLVVSEIYNFIGINPDFTPTSLNIQINKASNKRKFIYRTNKYLNNTLDKYDKTKIIKRCCKKIGIKNKHMSNLINKKVDYPSVTLEERNNIFKNIFLKNVESLERLIGKDLHIWKNNL